MLKQPRIVFQYTVRYFSWLKKTFTLKYYKCFIMYQICDSCNKIVYYISVESITYCTSMACQNPQFWSKGKNPWLGHIFFFVSVVSIFNWCCFYLNIFRCTSPEATLAATLIYLATGWTQNKYNQTPLLIKPNLTSLFYKYYISYYPLSLSSRKQPPYMVQFPPRLAACVVKNI